MKLADALEEIRSYRPAAFGAVTAEPETATLASWPLERTAKAEGTA